MTFVPASWVVVDVISHEDGVDDNHDDYDGDAEDVVDDNHEDDDDNHGNVEK